MANPQFIEQKALSLGEVKEILQAIEKRDGQLNYFSNKTKEYLDIMVTLTAHKRQELHKQLANLNLIRLKEEVMVKIIDFLPKNVSDLKVVLQGYNLSLSKKDQESIVEVVSKFIEE
ncbi:hypothetical protein HZC32_03720 [Candidatus Woesearchaeota archaeon]|nr:hypothetical protein [Candidatus Woesearchaeota archaeon]